MKVKLFAFLTCLFIVAGCDDNSSTNLQSQYLQTESPKSQEIAKKVVHEVKLSPAVDFAMAKKIIPEGFQIVSYDKELNFLEGDFDGDNLQDFAAIIASDEAEYVQDAKDVRVVIYEQQPDNAFKKVAESGNLDGYFIHNVETSQLSLKKNVLSIKRQDMRFDNEWKFRYEQSIGDYALIGSEYNNYGDATGDGSGNRSINYLIGKKIEQFSEWNVENETLKKLPVKTTSVYSVNQKPILLKDLTAITFYDL